MREMANRMHIGRNNNTGAGLRQIRQAASLARRFCVSRVGKSENSLKSTFQPFELRPHRDLCR